MIASQLPRRFSHGNHLIRRIWKTDPALPNYIPQLSVRSFLLYEQRTPVSFLSQSRWDTGADFVPLRSSVIQRNFFSSKSNSGTGSSSSTPKDGLNSPFGASKTPEKTIFTPFKTDADRYYSSLEKFTKNADPAVDPKQGTLWYRFKDMFKKYWYVAVPVHMALSVGWFGLAYLLAVQGVDIMPFVEKLGLPDTWLEKFKKSGAGYFAAALLMYKVATPLRYSATLGVTTVAINVLRRRGYIKPAPTTAQVKKFIQEQHVKIASHRAARINKFKERFKKHSEEIRQRKQRKD